MVRIGLSVIGHADLCISYVAGPGTERNMTQGNSEGKNVNKIEGLGRIGRNCEGYLVVVDRKNSKETFCIQIFRASKS